MNAHDCQHFSPGPADIVLRDLCNPESSLTLGRQRAQLCFPASLAITPGCAVTRFRDQWSAMSAGRRGQGKNHTQPRAFTVESCVLGAQKQPKAEEGQEASPPSSLGDSSTVFLVMGQMGSVHREQAVAGGWGTRIATDRLALL